MTKPKPLRTCLDCPTLVDGRRLRCPPCSSIHKDQYDAKWKRENPGKVSQKNKKWWSKNGDRYRQVRQSKGKR